MHFMKRLLMGINHEKLLEKKQGTKFSPVYQYDIKGKHSEKIYLRLTNKKTAKPFPEKFEEIFEIRKKEADEFYEAVSPCQLHA